MTTRDKLERLRRSSPSPAPPRGSSRDALYRLEREILGEAATGEALSVKERLERLVAAKSRAVREKARPRPCARVPLEELIEGQALENSRGRFYVVESAFPLEHWHGRLSLSRLRLVSRSAFSALARGDDSAGLDLSRAVFLDTETTGLAGGSGTCPFLVGLGWVEEDQFRVRQLFMRDYPEEPALLEELTQLLSRFESLVTYNGKTFDLPLLESRFVLSRLRFPLAELPHFDLLHPARNLWKARLESCRLVELEYALLGFERMEDVPGELIPALYFDYVRSGDASRLPAVFLHNRNDILSLAALAVHASELVEEGSEPDHPVDDFSLGRIFERAGEPDRSIQHYTRALDGGVAGAVRRRSLRQLALHYKRREQWEQATELWRSLSAEEGPEAIEALEELAMHLEHRRQDFLGALELCEDALRRVEEDPRLPLGWRARWREELGRRRSRLERRSAQKRF
jgi:hypothetical protein